MRKILFKTLAKLNKSILPSYTKRKLDMEAAGKIQLAMIAWKLWVTKNALD